MERARKDMMQPTPVPQKMRILEYSAEFSPEEYEKIALGSVPQSMDDKWFIYLDGDTLNLHRSWTRFCIYQVKFACDGAKHAVRRTLVNRNWSLSGANDDISHAALVDSLIRCRLLGERIEARQWRPDQQLKNERPYAVGETESARKPRETKPWWKGW
jgi:hypothetical protein